MPYAQHFEQGNNVNIVFIIQLVQQKDGIQTELTRMSLAKTKLESLCRELQKHSKAVVVSACMYVCVYIHVCARIGVPMYVRVCAYHMHMCIHLNK